MNGELLINYKQSIKQVNKHENKIKVPQIKEWAKKSKRMKEERKR